MSDETGASSAVARIDRLEDWHAGQQLLLELAYHFLLQHQPAAGRTAARAGIQGLLEHLSDDERAPVERLLRSLDTPKPWLTLIPGGRPDPSPD